MRRTLLGMLARVDGMHSTLKVEGREAECQNSCVLCVTRIVITKSLDVFIALKDKQTALGGGNISVFLLQLSKKHDSRVRTN